MLYRHYNPWQITNSGEKETDRQLSDVPAGEIMHAIHSLRISSRYHPRQSAGECDFVVITRLGITVMEVKGGEIGYGDAGDNARGFYRISSADESIEPITDPFRQVDANADALMKFLSDKGFSDVFVGKLVCFPECDFDRDSISDEFLWHAESRMSLPEMILEEMERQIEKYRANEVARSYSRYTSWKELEDDDFTDLRRALEPEFNPDLNRSLVRLNLAEADRRRKEGLNVLSGLDENKRLMVQGPPGSGKSTYAFEVIRRLCCREGKTGLYICWNALLGDEMKQRLSDPAEGIPPESVDARLFFDIAVEFGTLSGDKKLIPGKDTVKKGELGNLLKGSVAKCSKKEYKKYDFLVIDEAQDIFDKGLDHIVKALLKCNNPVKHGNYYIFYDDSQDYPETDNSNSYVRTRDMFRSCTATYNLTVSLRVNTGRGIDDLIRDLAAGNFNNGKDYGNDVLIRIWRNPADALREIRQGIAKAKMDGIQPENCLVLFTHDLLKDEASFPAILKADGGYELLTTGNPAAVQGKTAYTTMLRAKGLERDAIFLVSSSPEDRKIRFEVFIGASRAKCRVYLIVPA